MEHLKLSDLIKMHVCCNYQLHYFREKMVGGMVWKHKVRYKLQKVVIFGGVTLAEIPSKTM